ncbi:hypothetical protein N9917_02000 [Deltaproteobacteria bacterium]|nr:hypothetical protein [Deltaproteobacteria bacterium]
MKRLLFLLLFATGVSANNSQEGSLNTFHGDDSITNSNNNTTDTSTSNTYNGAGSSSEIPVGSAITPSYMSNGMDTCLKGSGGSLQTVGVGISSGAYEVDPNCDRRRDAKLLSDLGMKVAAVSRMCESLEVWKSMFVSGTPCPILQNSKLVAGKRAYIAMKMNPEIYIPDYSKKTKEWYDSILNIGETINEEQAEDTPSISTMFRSSIK